MTQFVMQEIAAPLVHVIGSLVLITTALPMIRRGWWWVRIWDFPRTQNAIIGPAVLLTGLLTLPMTGWNLGFIAALAAVSGYQVWRVWPFIPLAPPQALPPNSDDPARRLSILVSNVQVGNRDSERVLRAVRAADPDIWLALETDGWWCERLRALDEGFPDRFERPLDNAYGMFFRSRLPVEALDERCLVEPDVPSIRARIRLPSGERITFYGLHPRPPHTFQASFGRDAELIVAAREIAADGTPSVVAGDFNDVPWSRPCRIFQKLSGLLDPRLGRGLYNTFNAHSWISRWPLDHVFFSAEFRLVRIERQQATGSDHYPLLVELSYEPEGTGEQAARAMQPGDKSVAETLVRRADGIG